MKKNLLKLTPNFILEWYRSINEKIALAKSSRLKKEQTISKEDIKEILKSCEIDSDIYLHTSLHQLYQVPAENLHFYQQVEDYNQYLLLQE